MTQEQIEALRHAGGTLDGLADGLRELGCTGSAQRASDASNRLMAAFRDVLQQYAIEAQRMHDMS